MIKNLKPRLAEVGKIKIGKKGEERKKTGGGTFRLPMKDDRFTITTVMKDKDDDFIHDKETMERIAEITGQQPDKLTELPIRLLYDDPEMNFPTSYAFYEGTKCRCRGDGEVATEINTNTGEIVDDKKKCPCKYMNPELQGNKCKPHGCLTVLLEGAGTIGGVWRFRTTSINSVMNIMSSLAFIASITRGIVSGLPLFLVLEPKAAIIPGKGTKITIFVVRIEYRGSGQELAQIGYEEAERRAVGKVRMDEIENLARKQLALPAPDEDEDLVEEFHPEAIAEEGSDSMDQLNEDLNKEEEQEENYAIEEILAHIKECESGGWLTKYMGSIKDDLAAMRKKDRDLIIQSANEKQKALSDALKDIQGPPYDDPPPEHETNPADKPDLEPEEDPLREKNPPKVPKPDPGRLF